jgi:spermidine synthase
MFAAQRLHRAGFAVGASHMTSKISSSSLLIFGSGLAALVYQTTWLREFRLIFGNSTAASAAVLGIFMGGLGLGSALLGNRAERTPRPLAFYATLEFLIAVSAALTPGLIWLIRGAYVASGGTFAMGNLAGTCIRLLLAAIVVAVPTVLMGGTLPAMARFAVNTDDGNRRGLALLYGMNTLGAVAGAALGTFYFFERFGNHLTLWLACAFNAGIAGVAWLIARKEGLLQLKPNTRHEDTLREAVAPLPLILTASAVTGFVFLLMELVWYRMLSPTFGGTAFTFGLILAVALLGIGVGGVMYSLVAGERRPTLYGFACTCALEALFVIIPFALGDRLTIVAMLLQPLGNLGFHGSVLGWSLLCAVIVFPVAVVAGVQFPMLLGLLGRGREGIGRQTGAAYAWNTLGAIVGSLAGGFGLIPLLSAPGTWRLVATLLVLFALAAVVVAQRQRGNPLRALPSLAIGACVILLLIFADGPSAAWRHSQLSMLKQYDRSPNETRDLLQSLRRDILWQADGIESSIGISKSQSLAFIVSGKSDGNSKRDAGTQVMSGLLAALMHPNPQKAFVVGLGTGSTAGWLAAVPSIDRVDVVELEPVLKRFATQCAPVNHNALANPKVNLIIGDGREFLLTSKEKYDLVVSEPSNPYRAGIASLFTREYYQAIAQNLNSGGLFAQWVQAYDIDLRTLRIFYATVSSVFPQIETWQTQSGDLLLLASKDPIKYDLDALRTRIVSQPFQSALTNVWRTTDLEGVFSHYVGNNQFAHQVMQRSGIPLNTDDRMVLEFAFARNRQTGHHLSFEEMRREAHLAAADRPTASGDLDWSKVEQQRYEMFVDSDHARQPEPWMSERQRAFAGALTNYAAGNLAGALENWKIYQGEPHTPIELMMVAESLAEQGSEDAARYIAQLENIDATAALALRARLAWQQNRREEARTTMGKALAALHSDPWPLRALISRTIDLAVEMVEQSNGGADPAIYAALQTPLAVYNNDEERMLALIRVAVILDRGVKGERVLRSVAAAEPNVPWNLGFLKIRSACYTASRHPLAEEAQTDLVDFAMAEPEKLQSSTPGPAKGPRLAEAAR